MPKKTAKTGKRSGVLERKSAELQKVSSVKETPFNTSHHLITLSAFRYALGRRSYIVGEVIDWMEKYWDEIDHKTKVIIINEVHSALSMGCAGDECDQKAWEIFLEMAEKSMKFL